MHFEYNIYSRFRRTQYTERDHHSIIFEFDRVVNDVYLIIRCVLYTWVSGYKCSLAVHNYYHLILLRAFTVYTHSNIYIHSLRLGIMK